MSAAQIERATEQLYQDASARDELTDDEASVLLQWGEAQIAALSARELDEAAFDEAYAKLRRVLLRMNRFTGRHADMTPEEQQEALDALAADAQAFGFQTQPAQMVVAQAQGAPDNIALIRALAAWLSPEQAASAEPTPSPPVDNARPESGLRGWFKNWTAEDDE